MFVYAISGPLILYLQIRDIQPAGVEGPKIGWSSIVCWVRAVLSSEECSTLIMRSNVMHVLHFLLWKLCVYAVQCILYAQSNDFESFNSHE